LSHISHRYTLHDNESEVFSAKFSPDSSYMATSYADGSVSIYSSMLGDPLYYIKDSEMIYPITGISWKPTGRLNSDI
jgi:WD40 repeat protein